MNKKQVRKWQFVDDNGEVVNGQVEIGDQAYDALQNMSENERKRMFDHYDRLTRIRHCRTYLRKQE